MSGQNPAAEECQEIYDELAAEYLRMPEVSVGRSLQSDVLKINGKMFAFLKGDRLVVKLPAARAAGLVADGAAVPFESGGRPMREWVAVSMPTPAAGEGRWRDLMDEASRYVAELAGGGERAGHRGRSTKTGDRRP